MSHRRIQAAALVAALLPLAGSRATCQEQEAGAPDLPALRAAAEAARARGAWGEAVEGFLRLHRLEPSRSRWVMDAALAMAAANRTGDALRLLGTNRETFGGEAEYLLLLSRAFHLHADAQRARGVEGPAIRSYYEDAGSVALEVLEQTPDDLQARLLLAQARFQLGDLDGAIEHGRRAMADHPGEPGGFLVVGQAEYIRFRQIQAAFQRDKPEGAEGPRMAERMDAARDAARRALSTAVELDPDRIVGWLRLGDLEGWSGRPEVAVDHFERAVAVDPKTIGQLDLGWMTGAVGFDRMAELWSNARTAYAARSDTDPLSLALLDYYGGRTLFDAGRQEDALEWFDRLGKLVELRTEFRDVDYWRMRIHYAAERYAKAGEAGARFAERAPRDFADLVRRAPDPAGATEIVQFLADDAFGSRKIRRSRDLNHVLALLRQSAEAWNNYAFLCRETQRYEDAWRGYSNALLAERSPQILNDAAVILHYHLKSPENLAKARAMYTEAIALAKKMLAEGGLGTDEEARTRTALRDATSNLRSLGR